MKTRSNVSVYMFSRDDTLIHGVNIVQESASTQAQDLHLHKLNLQLVSGFIFNIT